MRLLLVEDDPVLANNIRQILYRDGFAVDVAGSDRDAGQSVQRHQYALVMLDLAPYGLDRIDILRRIRAADNHLPVLLLGTSHSVGDCIHGLELGADDYLVKPFGAEDLLARLRAVMLRRRCLERQELRIGALSLDDAAKSASINGAKIDLTAQQWQILEYLMRHSPEVVSKDQIIHAVHLSGREITLNAVEAQISRIRAKILGAGVHIRTVRGFGYALEAEIF